MPDNNIKSRLNAILEDEHLVEMPVANIEREADWVDDNRFRHRDQKYISTPKYDAIVVKKLQRVPFDMFIYILDNEVTREEIGLASNNDKTFSLFYDPYNLKDNKTISGLLGPKRSELLRSNRQGVHMLITHNDPDADRWMPLTPWMIMHRLSHAVLDNGQMGMQHIPGVKEVRKTFSKFYDGLMDIVEEIESSGIYIETSVGELWEMLLPYKSANNDVTTDWYEVSMDLFTYYCYSGGEMKFKETKYPTLNNFGVTMRAEFQAVFSELVKEISGVLWTG